LEEAARKQIEERPVHARELPHCTGAPASNPHRKPEDGGKPPAIRDVNEAAAGMYRKPIETMAREFRHCPFEPAIMNNAEPTNVGLGERSL
jgi:hypothetical protein